MKLQDTGTRLTSDEVQVQVGLTLKEMIDAQKLGIDYEKSETNQALSGVDEAQYFLSLNTKSDYNYRINSTCSKFPDGAFCRSRGRNGFISSPSTGKSKRVSRAERNRVSKLIDSKKYDELPKTPELIISATRKWKRERQFKMAKEVLQVEKCLNSSVYFAAAYNSEASLPDIGVQPIIEQLYQKSVSCSDDESSARAAYRLAMFHLTNGQCKPAIPLFERVSKTPSLKFLHSRSLYWASKCQSQVTSSSMQGVETLYLLHPLSFHGMMGLQESGQEVLSRIKKNPEPLAVSRAQDSQDSGKWNQTLRAAETLIAAGEKRAARQLLTSLNMDEIMPKSAKLALYICYLLNRIEAGLLQFQALAMLFSGNPELKTPTTMKLFYPNWRFDIIKKYAEEVGLDPYLVIGLIRQESAFKIDAKSRARAMGLMQILPSTARSVDRRVSKSMLLDPETNVRIGTKYLLRVINRFDGNVHLALAGYNAGSGIVSTWMRRYPTTDTVIMGDLIPFRETREYIGSVMRNYYWYKALYGGQAISVLAPKIPTLEGVAAAPAEPEAVAAITPEESKQVEEDKSLPSNDPLVEKLPEELAPTDAETDAEGLVIPFEESTPDI